MSLKQSERFAADEKVAMKKRAFGESTLLARIAALVKKAVS
jgi:hypothetical protein